MNSGECAGLQIAEELYLCGDALSMMGYLRHARVSTGVASGVGELRWRGNLESVVEQFVVADLSLVGSDVGRADGARGPALVGGQPQRIFTVVDRAAA